MRVYKDGSVFLNADDLAAIKRMRKSTAGRSFYDVAAEAGKRGNTARATRQRKREEAAWRQLQSDFGTDGIEAGEWREDAPAAPAADPAGLTDAIAAVRRTRRRNTKAADAVKSA